ncbi:M20/M25/M40 family metallo-hydrolase [Candidatus Roizmanbacteria bacterium]|nr:M20/M25/M40 family metallo-hydrolase [Candidatus Roizmanbacteria bacterium]
MDTSLLKQLIRTPSVFPNEKRLSQFISRWVDKNVPGVKKQLQRVADMRENLMLSKGNNKKSILLIGHLDTIPVVSDWKTDPYTPIVKGGNLTGLGAWDMKAGLYIILQCLKKYNPKNITLKAAFTVDEENYSQGAHALIKTEFSKNTVLILVPEPGFTHGHYGITIGRTGRSTYTVLIRGKSAHGSKSYEGVNAISEAQIFIKEILTLKFPKDQSFGKTTLFPSMIQSSAKGFSVPDECELELDCKLVYPDTPQTVFKKINNMGKQLYGSKKLKYLPTVSYKKRPTPFCAPYKIDRNNHYVKLCKKIIEEVAGKSIAFYRESVADECIYVEKLKIPAICIGPQGKNAHKAGESVNIQSIQIVENIYLKLLEQIDKQNSE